MDSDGLIDIHFSESFLNYANRSTLLPDDDTLFSFKYQSQPNPLTDANPSGTIWTSSDQKFIHVSFPSSPSSSSSSTSSLSSKSHNYTSPAPTSPNPIASTPPELVLIWSPTTNSWILSSPLPSSHSLTFKPDRLNKFPKEVPSVPTGEELGKKTKEFWEKEGKGLNPFELGSKGGGGLGITEGDTEMRDGADSEEEEEDDETQPRLANVPSYLRNPASTSTATTPIAKGKDTEVEDFGSLSFGTENGGANGNKMEIDQAQLAQPTSNSSASGGAGLVLPKKKADTITPVAVVAPRSPQPPTQPRPQFSSKIPASSTRNPPPSASTDLAASDSSSDEEDDDDDDDDFEDVSIPQSQSQSQPSNPNPNLNPIPSSLPSLPANPAPVSQPPSKSTEQKSRTSNHQRLSTSLRNIIDPPSSPVSVPTPSLPALPSSSSRPPTTTHRQPSSTGPGGRPMVGGKLPASSANVPIKKRKSSLLPEDQASSDSSSSSSDDDSDSNDELEASINASMMAQNQGKVAMSSGGKGRRTNVPPQGQGGAGQNQPMRPMVSRKGLAPPHPAMPQSREGSSQSVPLAKAGSGRSGRAGATAGQAGGSTISAYDAQRLAQYGSNYPALHQRALSNNGVPIAAGGGGGGGGTASPVIGVGRVELESSGDEEEEEDSSDSD
ncbi:uncharacterized protein JCM6883_004453 [Sporobolomyces salmoneus]|uniref:uncharacterized protein n=1 Tax=Sporobolomyces salmoneus TaxID=183962 RepID=UPI00317B18E8